MKKDQSHHSPSLFEQSKDTNNKLLNPVFELIKYSIGVEDIQTEVEQLLKQGNEAKESKGLFTVKTASRWIEQAKTRPIPKMLFGEFWFEGELCILFADTNLGKSILAVQIGNSISSVFKKTIHFIERCT
jgi:hypothetical protein